MTWKQMQMTGWGRNAYATVRAARPERARELESAFGETGSGGTLARGAGRAYGDAALNDGGDVILTERLDRILSFDEATGDVACEAGVTFADLIDVFLPRGFMAPASPGTAFATIGGAVAADVHGKNHDQHGSFGNHVQWIDLLMADGITRRITPENDAELLAATIGGMGLTGIIRAAGFRMLKAGPAVELREERIRNLDHFLEAFAQMRSRAMFSVGWIDALAKGASLGRGILETAEFSPSEPLAMRAGTRKVPVDFPAIALNRLSVKLFNSVYLRRVPEGGRTRLRPLPEFLYPLDALHDWNRIYGKRGFYQFQCVVPDATASVALRQMLEMISATGNPSFLAVLKTLGGPGRGYLSFPIKGHTLALDFPRSAESDALIFRLETIARDHGGRVYLAKDSLLTREAFEAMYPDAAKFVSVVARVDPDSRFTSDQARRLGLKPTR